MSKSIRQIRETNAQVSAGYAKADADSLRATIADLEAENARLEGIQLQAQELILRAEDWRDERDGYKALAERRGEALEWYEERAKALTRFKEQPDRFLMAIFTELSLDAGKRARAALAATPEEGGMDEATAKVYKEGLIAMHDERHPDGD